MFILIGVLLFGLLRQFLLIHYRQTIKNLAHDDLVQSWKHRWDPLIFRCILLGSSLIDPFPRQRLQMTCITYLVMMQINKQENPAFRHLTQLIHKHSHSQMDVLLDIYNYLADLNQVHSALRKEKY